jgi:hypothetical protein
MEEPWPIVSLIDFRARSRDPRKEVEQTSHSEASDNSIQPKHTLFDPIVELRSRRTSSKSTQEETVVNPESSPEAGIGDSYQVQTQRERLDGLGRDPMD